MKSDTAVSELVGTILLVSLVVLAASIVAVAVLSQPTPQDIPQLTALADNQSKIVYILHTGGDSLQENEIKTVVNGQDSTFSLEENANWPWSAGKILKVSYTGTGMPEYVQLIYTGGSSQTLILTTYFVPAEAFGAPPTIPTTLPTSIPTTIVTTLPTTVPPNGGGCSDVIADFIATPRTGSIPLLVTFTDNSSSLDPIANRTWNFGDGNVTTTTNPSITHTYNSVGSYTVILTATNACGNSNIKTVPNFIVTTCPPVTASFTSNLTSGPIPLTVLFTDTSVSGVPITSRTWNFGDGNVTTTTNPSIIHTYTAIGTYTVNLTATNTCGQSGNKIVPNFIVTTCPPLTASFTGSPTSGPIPLTVLFTDTSVSVVPITSRTWNFGDGNVTTTTNPTISHTYTLAGPYTVTLNASNSCGSSQTIIKSNYVSATYTANGAVINLTKNCGSAGYMLDGTYYQFTAGPWDTIRINGIYQPINNTDQVRLVINGNQSSGRIYMYHPAIYEFYFNVKLYVNGVYRATGFVTSIWASAHKNQDRSNLTYILDPSCTAYTHLIIDGNDVINQVDSSRIRITNMQIIHDNVDPYVKMFIVNLDGSHNQINTEADIVIY